MRIKISIFADDCAFWASLKDFEMLRSRVQLMLSRLTEWSNRWGSVFSASKSTGVIFTKKRLPQYPVLTLNNQQIPIETSVKFLGMIFDHGLTWEKQIKSLKSRCSKPLSLLSLLSHISWGANRECQIRVYQALVRSIIDYGSFL